MLSLKTIAAFLAGPSLVAAAGAVYKNPNVPVEARVSDLLSRMTIEDKTAQLMQGDISNWINTTTNAFNYSGLVANMETKAGQFYVGYPVPQSWISAGVKRAQEYLMQNTTLGSLLYPNTIFKLV